MLMLNHLGSRGVKYLTSDPDDSAHPRYVANWKSCPATETWKTGKPWGVLSSESLLSLVLKTLEALLLPTFTHHLSLAEDEHGFRKKHSTTPILSVIKVEITRDFNQKPACGRTILIALGLVKSF